MRLKNIGISLKTKKRPKEEGIRQIQFRYQGDAAASFLSGKAKKEGIDCDGFNAIFFFPVSSDEGIEETQIKYKSLCVDVPIDWGGYEDVMDSPEGFGVFVCEFYRQGIERLQPEHGLPKEVMLDWVGAFEAANYEHRGVFKKRLFREIGLTAELHYKTDFQAFQLSMVVKKGKQILFKETILEEEPDPLLYHHKFKDIELKDGKIVVPMRLGDEFLFAKPVKEILCLPEEQG